MANNIKALFSKTKDKVMASFIGKMEEFIKVVGLKENSTVKENLKTLKVKLVKGCGTWAK